MRYMPHRDQTNIGRAIKKGSTNGTNSTVVALTLTRCLASSKADQMP